MNIGERLGETIGALPQTPQGNSVPLTLTTLSLCDSWDVRFVMLSRSLEGSLAWISCPSQIATSNQREAKMGSGDWSPGWGGWGMKSPIVPLLRSHEEKQSGSRAKPDGRFTHHSVLFESLIKNTKNTLSPSMERTCFVKFRNPILSAECVTQSCFPYIALVTCCPCLVSFST